MEFARNEHPLRSMYGATRGICDILIATDITKLRKLIHIYVLALFKVEIKNYFCKKNCQVTSLVMKYGCDPQLRLVTRSSDIVLGHVIIHIVQHTYFDLFTILYESSNITIIINVVKIKCT